MSDRGRRVDDLSGRNDGEAVTAVTPLEQTVGMWQFPCPDPEACALSPRMHRPYASARGKNRVESISAFTDLVSGGGDGLVHYGAGEGATVCYWQQDAMADLEMSDYVSKVRRTVAAMRGTDADLGTYAHTAVECWANGITWTEPEIEYDHDRQRLWNFVSGLARWWQHRQPTVLASEFIVANDDPAYVGTGDLLCVMDDVVVYVDPKTHRRHKEDEKSSFGKWQLQGNMIGAARDLRHYHGNQLITAIAWDDTDLPRPTRGLVVSVGPEGQIREYGYDIDTEATLPLVASLSDVLAYKPAVKQILGVPVMVPKYEPRPDAPVSVGAFLD